MLSIKSSNWRHSFPRVQNGRGWILRALFLLPLQFAAAQNGPLGNYTAQYPKTFSSHGTSAIYFNAPIYCGPNAVHYVLNEKIGVKVSYTAIVAQSNLTSRGVNMFDLISILRTYLKEDVFTYRLSYEVLRNNFNRFAIVRVHDEQNKSSKHWLVVTDINATEVEVVSPPLAASWMRRADFVRVWEGEAIMDARKRWLHNEWLVAVGIVIGVSAKLFHMYRSERADK